MRAYLVRRAVQSAFTIAILMALLFVVFNILGDPIRLMLPIDASEGQIQALRKVHGLDRPIYVQFGDFIGGIVRGDFGISIRHHVPALSMIWQRLPKTALLAGAAILVALLGIPLGLFAARKPRGVADRIVNVISYAGISTPEFWIGLMLILFFAVQLHLLPTSGFGGYGGWKYLILPVMTLAPQILGRLAQISRAAVVEELGKQYVATARAKGLSETTVWWVHVLKNAAPVIVTLGGDALIGLMNGSVVAETIFGWPGLGQLIIQAINDRDLPVVSAAIFVVALLVMAINLTVDIIYTWLDPRVKYR